jgi:CDP-diacylglycerol---glycerol-3-phosphate 3-phosphatidyltransferase
VPCLARRLELAMPSIYQLKPAFQAQLRPLVSALARLGVTPNQVTLLALFVSVGLGAALALNPQSKVLLLAVPAWLFLRMALNAIDGMLAREHNMKTALGAVLNEVGDTLSDAALILPLIWVLPGLTWLCVTFTLLAILTEFVGVLMQALGGARRYDGPMGKSDRAAIVGLLCLLLGTGVAAGAWCGILLGVASLLTAATAWNRARRGLQQVRAKI